MKGPHLFRQKKPLPAQNIKLMCSFNGSFRLFLPSNKLRYVGGETRIVSFDRNISFSKFVLKISELCPKLHSISIKYKVPVRNPDGEAALVAVDTDDDVRRMIEEHDKIEAEVKPSRRVRVFVCGYNGNLNSNSQRFSHDLNADNRVLLKRNAKTHGIQTTHVGRIGNLSEFSCGNALNTTSMAGIRSSGDEFVAVNALEPRIPTTHFAVIQNSGGLYNEDVTRIQNFGSSSRVLGSNRMGTKISPSNFIVRNDGLYRNHRIYSYSIQNYRISPYDVMNHRISGFDGNPCSGWCYAMLRPRSNILKFGQVRSPYAHFGKPWYEHSQERTGKNVESSKGTQTLFNFENGRGISRGQIVEPRGGFLGKEFGNQNGYTDHLQFNRVSPTLYSRDITVGKDLLPDLDLKCPPHNPKIQLDRVHMNLEAAAKESTTNCDAFDNLSCVVNPSVDLSVHNLSSPSSTAVGLPMLYSSPSISGALGSVGCLRMYDVNNISVHDNTFSRCGMGTQLNQSDLAHGKENKQITVLSSLIMEEKASSVKGSGSCSKVGGGISSHLAAFYTQLDTRELQTIKNSDLEEIRELASGTYGTVFHGKWRGSDVAIKRIKASCFGGGELGENRLISDFWKEARILGQLHHPNVMAFYGVVIDGPPTSLATVTEFMVNGSLKQVLKKKDRTIDRRKRIIIAMDAAFGMEYLHEKNIVHFDLKSHNLLVNMRDPHRPVCKIGDLGLSKVKQKKLVSCGVQGTIPWMAPELFSDKRNMVSEKIDVYSFGIVMWELLTGEEPYANMQSEEIIAGIIKGDLRPEVPGWCDPLWRSLMERCWSSNPDSRPAFSEIAKELRAIAASMNIK